jgi:hypothetical protein
MAASILLNFCSVLVKNISLSYLIRTYTGTRDESYLLSMLSQARSIIAPVVYFDAHNNFITPEYLFNWIDIPERKEIEKRMTSPFIHNFDEACLPNLKKYLKELEENRIKLKNSSISLVERVEEPIATGPVAIMR